ncbi:hypothetical protein F5B22DRAFT_545718 [Xylaria bambusicola]|uniref:uncharacterized protein n=1 Tax=Xylaria bambusicola TaxID=326684 RepID=UPI0020084755|nr:uncharacterized protein F5B22DRAFT_545718 [Xylaria bambusicola]KAI0521643.1 hypothetical protein F5B22DRAFT_545718 [Xylaria bambusicola]
MPPSNELLTDDYVAELLAKEATDCSIKYSAMGLDAFKPDRRPANQPKPNTRFLNNIIRDTNSHNRALLAKENAESQARLRDLEEADRKKRDEEERKERRSKPGPSDTRKRMLGDIAAILGGPSKRRRPEESDRKSSRIKLDQDILESTDSRDRKGKSRETRHRDEDLKHKSRSRRDDSRDRHHHSHRREERRRHHSSSSEEREDRHRERRERSSRGKDSHSRHHRHPDKRDERKRSPSPTKDPDSDSDPLNDIIGPAPPSKSTVQRRGRGHNAAMSGIDSRFAADYDPTIDVTPDPDEKGDGDWDNAVEAFRDRQKWKQQGADRLRSAGFTEDQIRKWEKGDKKDESDVQWNKAGGVREWDRGKVLDDIDNRLSPEEPEYGRLKGT